MLWKLSPDIAAGGKRVALVKQIPGLSGLVLSLMGFTDMARLTVKGHNDGQGL